MNKAKTMIYDITKKRHVNPKNAIIAGIKSNLRLFNIPLGFAILKSGNKYTLEKIVKLKTLHRAGKINIEDVIGDIDFNPDTSIISKSSLTKRDKTKYQAKKDFVKHKVLNNTEKHVDNILYRFILDTVKYENVEGENPILTVSMNGRSILTKTLRFSEYDTLSHWWKRSGYYIGMVNSDYRIWEGFDQNIIINNYASTEIKFPLIVYNSKLQEINEKYGNEDEREGDDVYKARAMEQVALKQFEQNKIRVKNTQIKFYLSFDQKLVSKKIIQTFRDNETNSCFFDVIENTLLQKMNDPDTNQSGMKKYNACLNKLYKQKSNFPNGVLEKNIQPICDELKINVEICDLFHKNNRVYKSKIKSWFKTIKYINSRFNHVEEYFDNGNNVIEIESKEKMSDILKDSMKNNIPTYYIGKPKEPSYIYTSKCTYKMKNKVNDAIQEFNDEIKLNDHGLDYMTQRDTIEFLRNGINYNAHCSFQRLEDMEDGEVEDNPDLYTEYDMKAAYTRYEDSKYYVGFPNTMTPILNLKDWTIEKCKQYIGYYEVRVLSIESPNKTKILEELGFEIDKLYILSTPELLLFHKHNVEFEFIRGSYSFVPYKFSLTPEMLKNRKYCIWAGKLNTLILTNNYKTICDVDMSKVLRYQYDNLTVNEYIQNVFNDPTKVECRITYDKKEVVFYGHIGGFVTAYTRCTVLDELLKIKHKRILGYKLDGFIIEGNEPSINKQTDSWTSKILKTTFNWGPTIFNHLEFDEKIKSAIYENNMTMDEKYPYDKDIFKSRVTLLSGPGGCGKSHYILDNMKDTLYVGPSWRLITEKMKEYDIKGITIHQLLGIQCEKYTFTHKVPTRILIDEITMVQESWIKDVIKLFPYAQIYLAGDVDKIGYYQCSNKDIKVLKDFNNIDIVTFDKNYRCKDSELLTRLNDLRQFMRDCKFNYAKITEYVKNKFGDRKMTKDELINTYDYHNDSILCSTTNSDTSQTKYYTDLLKGDKYLCVKHTHDSIFKKTNGDSNVYLTGEITYDNIKESCYFERRDAFTIHSFQGLTIKNPGRLIIDLDNIFCPRQLYTALSRVEYLTQIHII